MLWPECLLQEREELRETDKIVRTVDLMQLVVALVNAISPMTDSVRTYRPCVGLAAGSGAAPGLSPRVDPVEVLCGTQAGHWRPPLSPPLLLGRTPPQHYWPPRGGLY